MTSDTNLGRARAAFARRAWREAAEAYVAADREARLDLPDLEQAGLAAHLIDRDEISVDLRTRAHHEAVRQGDMPHAARIAFWIGMSMMQRGDIAVAGGWMARAFRLVEESGTDCVERGYLLVPEGLRSLDSGQPTVALATFKKAAAIAERFRDDELATLARLGRGQALIDVGQVEHGVALLDEAMLAVTAGEVGPVIAGIVYCASIEAFHAVFDVRRAQQWTDALTRWCAAQPDLVPFRGRCLVYRAELMRLHGAWREASDEARRAEEWLSRPPPEPAVGEALYEKAELRRLRGNFAGADAAYREASRWGRRPEPGLALLKLARGRTSTALAMIRRALGEMPNEIAKAGLLEPYVEIALAARDLDAARGAADDLARVAATTGAPLLAASAARADGVVRLAEGDAESALPALRRAAAGWHELDVPYDLARVRVSIANALRALGDADTAGLELESARRTFASLGAEPDLARVDSIIGALERGPGGLSRRELEVLRLLAGGLTNRAIADELVISERTVDRHVSNLYAKLDVASRAAATAFAYEHGIVEG